MRWSWRANLLPVTLDALLEGSLVGIAYLALALGGRPSSAPLSLVFFWLAAGAGLCVARWHPRHLARVNWVPALALLAGVAGWLSDPAALNTFLSAEGPLAAVPVHPAGWLLGLAVLLGAAHENMAVESETATRAVVLAFPVLAVSLLLHGSSGGAFGASAFVGTVVCVSAGLLAIGNARLRELEALGTVTRGGRTWPILGGAVVLVAVWAIPIAVVLSASGRDAAASTLGPLGVLAGWLLSLLAGVAGWLGWVFQQVFDTLFGRPAPPHAVTATPTPRPVKPITQTAAGWTVALPDVAAVRSIVIGGLLIVVALLLFRFRRYIPRREPALPVTVPGEERRREPHRPFLGLHLHLPKPALFAHLSMRRRPMSAAQAYVALLDDLADEDDLGRMPAETPRNHAERAGRLGLDRLPLGLLAADYELAVYGRADISHAETKRAIGRWRRLRKLAKHVGRSGGWEVDEE